MLAEVIVIDRRKCASLFPAPPYSSLGLSNILLHAPIYLFMAWETLQKARLQVARIIVHISDGPDSGDPASLLADLRTPSRGVEVRLTYARINPA